MKKIIIIILISVFSVMLFSHKTLSFATENNTQPATRKLSDSSLKIHTLTGSILEVSSNETFPLPDPIQRRAIAIIIIGSIPVGFLFLIILYRSRRRKIKKKMFQN